MGTKMFRNSRGCALKRGQMTVEYSVMFVVVVAVIIWAASTVVKPSVNRYFNSTGKIIDKATSEMQSVY